MKTLTEGQIKAVRSGFIKDSTIYALCDMALEYLKCREDAERYQYLKRHLYEPHAINHFVAFNNWHPDERAILTDLDAAIDAARKEGA